MFAFNDPKKYPKKPITQEDEGKKKEMTAEQMERMARIITKSLKGKIYGNRRTKIADNGEYLSI